ncbi:mobilization protein MbpA [Christiangramia fulva]|uniref:mobilization protein MbpA n=1 Tax=Christiangramia fulva TaxID=2126553 RepID=UPI001D03BF07|nr:mobilization protein MbpA [Christiangramia fulva]
MKKKPDSQLKLFKLKFPFEETENPRKNPDAPRENSTSEFSNSRCVPVDTILIAPDGRNEKKRFRGKGDLVKFRCSSFEKKLLLIKAKKSGLTLSEYCRRSAFGLEITERLSDDQIAIYKTLLQFHNNFKWIGNMFRRKDPRLSSAVYKLAEEIKSHLQKIV